MKNSEGGLTTILSPDNSDNMSMNGTPVVNDQEMSCTQTIPHGWTEIARPRCGKAKKLPVRLRPLFESFLSDMP